MPQALRRSYAFIGLNSLSKPTKNVHHTSVQPSPVPPPVPSATHTDTDMPVLQSIKRPHRLLPHRSSLLGPRQSSLFRRSLHPSPQIIPPFKPGKT